MCHQVVSNLGEEEGMKWSATVERTSVGTVLSKLGQEEGDRSSHLVG